MSVGEDLRIVATVINVAPVDVHRTPMVSPLALSLEHERLPILLSLCRYVMQEYYRTCMWACSGHSG